jgi:hypothetical protein
MITKEYRLWKKSVSIICVLDLTFSLPEYCPVRGSRSIRPKDVAHVSTHTVQHVLKSSNGLLSGPVTHEETFDALSKSHRLYGTNS